MKILRLLTFVAIPLLAVAMLAQTPATPSAGEPLLLKPEMLLKEPVTAWPTYNGDYSGRRYSTLKQINASNVQDLSVAWIYQVGGGRGPQQIPGGIDSTPLMVDGVLYFTVPDHVFAVDARTGQQLWHFDWVNHGGLLIVGNRGLGMYGNWLYFMTPDDWLVSLNARTGKERWQKQISDPKQGYFASIAPLVVKNHVLVSAGGDTLDLQSYVEARDPVTGALQWRWNETPGPGQPGFDTWPNADAASHGGGNPWQPFTYDPKLNLIYVATGNPNPVYAGQGRKGSDLYTASLVALNPDTGKLVWYFQGSPHDTHDWDQTEAPVLFNGVIHGKEEPLVAQASRNGYFFVENRANGKNYVAVPYVPLNWSKGVNRRGEPIPNPKKYPTVDGTLVSVTGGGATNWFPPSFDPQTGLFYVNATEGYSIAYLQTTNKNAQGFAGKAVTLASHGMLDALDYKTGKLAWQHVYPNESGEHAGILTTAGHLLFTGDTVGNLIAYDPANGNILWHYHQLGPVSNGPETYMLDGKQYLIVGAGRFLYAYTLSPGALQAAAHSE
jgi:acido-empty-quinoprotein group A